MKWLRDLVSPKHRAWEDTYRSRTQYDRAVRTTHGVNCTGSCSWIVHVKNGLVSWEMQAADYPSMGGDIPRYEPRGCPRGISHSWYVYSPLRVRYPYVRGTLIDAWNKARGETDDAVAAWAAVMESPETRSNIQQSRGKGGFRRASWDTVNEIISASLVYTIKKYGPDRIVGFSPIPAMSMVSYAAGSRFLNLLGGVIMSFYDWYSDLPPASPEVWGEQTDVAEAADWYNAKLIASVGSNISQTRTPDAHFLIESRANGAKIYVFSPEFSPTAKQADAWINMRAGQDGAFWMAVNHVILKEWFVDRETPQFLDYLCRYSDSPFLVELISTGDAHRAGRMLRAADLQLSTEMTASENAEWKPIMWDNLTQSPVTPQGTLGHRWQNREGQWNLELKNELDGSTIAPQISFWKQPKTVTTPVLFDDFVAGRPRIREVPARRLATPNGERLVTTVFDLLIAQFGVARDLAGDYPTDYDDPSPFTPAWQETLTGVSRNTVVNFAREWAATAEATEGRCMVIIGAGVNHWYHNDLIYRAPITALMLCGCIGRNGGGWNHYVGQEKVAPLSSWSNIAMAADWGGPPRLQNTPSFHYIHSDQWRYDGDSSIFSQAPQSHPLTDDHPADLQVRSVRMGWLPFYPQFTQNPLQVAGDTDATTPTQVAAALKKGDLQLAVADPDVPENWPRVWFIWRANALNSSAKGQEFFFKHYLGTHSNALTREIEEKTFREIRWHEQAPSGKFDLVVDLNFRMDTSALYSDIVLPAASWYEKNDLNTTDLHSYIHPLSAAVPPCWESKTDFAIFKTIAESFSTLAKTHLPQPVRDVVLTPLMHDTPAEMAQPQVRDWGRGECEPVPGKTMPQVTVRTRDYKNLYNQFCSLGPNVREKGIGAHGINWSCTDLYDNLLQHGPVVEWEGKRFPSLAQDVHVCNAILHLAPETNGEVGARAFASLEKKTGVRLADLAEANRGVHMTYEDLQKQPRRILTSPVWSGILATGRPYAGFTINRERNVPWRTLTGRQHFYIDHEGFVAYGESLPTYKPRPSANAVADMVTCPRDGRNIVLNYLTPHGKWQMHSTYYDNLRMLTLSRGMGGAWLNPTDAIAIEVEDNDWVELHNDHGVVVTRAIVSARIPQGICIVFHSTERTISVPKAPARGGRRAGSHNSLVRMRIKPMLLMGGYGHLTYSFNYWGPTGVNRDTYVLVRKLQGPVQF